MAENLVFLGCRPAQWIALRHICVLITYARCSDCKLACVRARVRACTRKLTVPAGFGRGWRSWCRPRPPKSACCGIGVHARDCARAYETSNSCTRTNDCAIAALGRALPASMRACAFSLPMHARRRVFAHHTACVGKPWRQQARRRSLVGESVSFMRKSKGRLWMLMNAAFAFPCFPSIRLFMCG